MAAAEGLTLGTYAPGSVLTYTGDGGAVAEWTVPPAADIHGTNLLESFIATGKITVTAVVDPDGDEQDAGTTPADDSGTEPATDDDVPAGNMDDVIGWVRGGVPEGEDLTDEAWVERAVRALSAEEASVKPRKTLVELLRSVIPTAE